jgi:hypothetical protein
MYTAVVTANVVEKESFLKTTEKLSVKVVKIPKKIITFKLIFSNER